MSKPRQQHIASRVSSLQRAVVLLAISITALTGLATFKARTVQFDSRLGEPLLKLHGFETFMGLAALSVLLVRFRSRRRLLVSLIAVAILLIAAALSPVYSPHKAILWIAQFWPSRFAYHLLRDLAAGLAALVVGAVAVSSRPNVSKAAHGSSRFAVQRELRSAGFLARRGVVFGSYRGTPVRHDGGEHVLAVMPTGAGKTSCFLIPTILSMEHDAMVISDIKGAEIFMATAGARATTHDIVRFEPSAKDTARWNPLAEVPIGPGDVAVLQRQANDFIVPPRHGVESHWHLAARELFVLLGLVTVYKPGIDATIGQARRLLLVQRERRGSGSSKPRAKAMRKTASSLFARILEQDHDPHRRLGWRHPDTGERCRLHPEVINLASRFLHTEKRELSSIISTLLTYLQPWADDRIDLATSRSDFRLADLAPGNPRERPMALYVIVPRSDLSRLSPLLRLFYSSLASLVCDDPRFVDWEARPQARRRRTYLFLDEFPMLGYMPVFGGMLATLRGYGATLFVVAQDLAQLREIYGPQEPVTGGCPIFLTAGSQRPETLRHISALAGEATVAWERRGRAISGGGFFGRRSRSTSTTETRRPLLTTGEVRTLSASDALLFAPGLHPVILTKTPYFKDGQLRKLASIEPPQSATPDTSPLEATP